MYAMFISYQIYGRHTHTHTDKSTKIPLGKGNDFLFSVVYMSVTVRLLVIGTFAIDYILNYNHLSMTVDSGFSFMNTVAEKNDDAEKWLDKKNQNRLSFTNTLHVYYFHIIVIEASRKK